MPAISSITGMALPCIKPAQLRPVSLSTSNSSSSASQRHVARSRVSGSQHKKQAIRNISPSPEVNDLPATIAPSLPPLEEAKQEDQAPLETAPPQLEADQDQGQDESTHSFTFHPPQHRPIYIHYAPHPACTKASTNPIKAKKMHSKRLVFKPQKKFLKRGQPAKDVRLKPQMKMHSNFYTRKYLPSPVVRRRPGDTRPLIYFYQKEFLHFTC